MSIDKLNTTPTNIENLQKLNQVIDALNDNTSYLYVGDIDDINPDLIKENLIHVDPDELLNLKIEDQIMIGATSENNGSAGWVPAPNKGSSNRFLAADATWKEINTSSFLKTSNVGNAPNKIVQYNSEGHLQLPTGIEIY